MMRILLIGIVLLSLLNSAPASASTPAVKAEVFLRDGLTQQVKELAYAALRNALHANAFWVRVHAAEFLIALGETGDVEDEFAKETDFETQRPERIGVWRVRYRLAGSKDDQEAVANRIRAVAHDQSATDRLHAVETLAKLRIQLPEVEVQAIVAATCDAGEHELAFGLWMAVTQEGNEQLQAQQEQLASLLASDDDLARLRAAYALWQVASKSPPLRDAIIDTGVRTTEQKAKESLEELAGAHVLATAWKTAELWEVDDDIRRFRDARIQELSTALKRAADESTEVSRVLADTLAELGTPADGDRLLEYLETDDPDLRASAANALLRIEIRFFKHQADSAAGSPLQP